MRHPWDSGQTEWTDKILPRACWPPPPHCLAKSRPLPSRVCGLAHGPAPTCTGHGYEANSFRSPTQPSLTISWGWFSSMQQLP